jgi:N-ethylmaleimide reductase
MTLSEFRSIYSGAIVGNCGYTKAAAQQRIAQGDADLIAFGRPFITNPDLPVRFENDWPLNPADDMSLWYTPGAQGYTDYLPFES